VIEFKDFKLDLTDWHDLYIAGRLQKPVKFHFNNPGLEPKFRHLVENNRKNALNAALLTLPEEFSERDLYVKICGLSYIGDARTGIAESKNKIEDIVDGSYELFREIYRPLMESYDVENLTFDEENKFIYQDLSRLAVIKKLSACPRNLQIEIASVAGQQDRQYRDVEEILRTVSRHPMPWDFVNEGLKNIVQKRSKESIALAAVSAGPTKALYYGLRKIAKFAKS